MALRGAGDTTEFARIDQLLTTYQTAYGKLLALYNEARSVSTLGLMPHPDLCRRLAMLREQMGRLDEARTWHRLVLRDTPDDPVSLAALARLK
jgi:hypothetical protein